MIKQVDNSKLGQITSVDSKFLFTIPRYQREYTWGKEQWETLFDDIMENDPGYFLGSIIVIDRGTNTATGITTFELVDGQQRMTTLGILLCALYKAFKEVNEDELEAYRRDKFHNEKDNLLYRLILEDDSTNEFKMRIVPQAQHNNLDDYRSLVFSLADVGVSVPRPNNAGNRRIWKAFNLFYGLIKNRLQDMDDAPSRARALQSLLSKVTSCILVTIHVNDVSDAYMLFESLNNRGIPLTPVDLIKNDLLASCDDSETDRVFFRWQGILRLIGDNYAEQERFLRQSYNACRLKLNALFDQSNGAFPLGNEATKSRLIGIYGKLIANKDFDALKWLETCAKAYGTLMLNDECPVDGDLADALADLERVKGVPGYQLLLALLLNREALKLSSNDIVDITRFLVRFFVRRHLTDTPPTYALTRLFTECAEKTNESGLTGADAIGYCEGLLKEASANDALFQDALEGKIYADNLDAARFVLVTLAKPSKTKERSDFWERGRSGNYLWTIEHILPQGENLPSAWVEMVGHGDADKAKQVQENLVHTLGNLTLTGYNSHLSNMSFERKRDRTNDAGEPIGYRNGLNLNKDLAERETWDERSITERTERLVAEALRAFAL